jgi:hypothetical protein
MSMFVALMKKIVSMLENQIKKVNIFTLVDIYSSYSYHVQPLWGLVQF